MTDHDDTTFAAVDLHAWRVPPPRAIDRADLLDRALMPATVPPRRSRVGWLLVAIVVLNAAIATLIVILVRPSPRTETVHMALPAGGDSESRVRDLVKRLEAQKRELDKKLAEIEALQARITEISKKLQERDLAIAELERNLRTVRGPKPPARKTPTRTTLSPPPPTTTPPPSTGQEPEALGRAEISSTMQTLRPKIVACGDKWPTDGTVKVRTRVAPDGNVTWIDVESPDNDLGTCVAKVVSGAWFSRTQKGGSFTYPFVFRRAP